MAERAPTQRNTPPSRIFLHWEDRSAGVSPLWSTATPSWNRERTLPEQLGGEGDLGDKEDRLSAGGAHLLDRPQVDLGLPGPGHAVQHEDGVPPRGDGDPDARKRGLLPGRGREIPRQVGKGRGVEGHRPGPRLHEQESFRGETLRRLRTARNPQRQIGRRQSPGLVDRFVRQALLRSHRTFGGKR